MTDNETIKSAMCCSGEEKDCEHCPYDKKETTRLCIIDLIADLLNIINRQKAEIKRLKEVVERLQHHNRALCMLEKQQINRIKSEARKEVADRLKQKKLYSVERRECIVPVAVIDWTLQEMESENNAV